MVKENLVFCSKESIKNAVYQKAGEDEEENSAVDAAHKLVRSVSGYYRNIAVEISGRTAVRYIKKTV